MSSQAENGRSPAARVDRASRPIGASPAQVYEALTDPGQLVRWLAPKGSRAEIDAFDPRPGGEIRITLTFDDPTQATKTTDNTDVVRGRFLTLERDRIVKQSFEFESSDPSFAGTMIMTWTLSPTIGGTLVELTAEDVPTGITPEDHRAGMTSSLHNLAALLEA